MNIQISGPVLESLRKRYKLNLEGASHVTGLSTDVLDKWEKEGVELPIGDAKKLAAKYKAHWSIFLLKSNVKPINDVANHRAGYTDNSHFSLETFHAYETARQILDASIEIDGQTVVPELRATKGDRAKSSDPVEMAHFVRELMGIDSADILRIRSAPSDVYKFWIGRLNELGFYVSEQEMPEEETKAFLMRDGDRAVIVVNKSDRYTFSKVFSVLHELGHFVRGESSAACKVSEYASRISKEETWCNRFASELAAYDSDVLSEEVVETLLASREPANIIRRLATKYRTSFTVMLYKLKQHEKISEKQCTEMLSFYNSVILPKFLPAKKQEGRTIQLSRSYYVSKDVARASLGLSREIIQRQINGSLSYGEAARMLGTKAGYIEDIKHSVGFGR